uniref:Serpin domain-containing protein n=1 Tax=Heliothis virescens TaxID=7102 RepID=A0A2A4J192_HELVI
MRLIYIFVYISFLVSAKKHKKRGSIGSSEYEEYDQAQKIHSSSEEPAPPSAHASFFELRGELRRSFALQAALDNHGRNMICSPISVMMPLGKLVLGAKRNTEKELLLALGLTKRKQVSTAFRLLITNMEYLPGVTLDVASRIYITAKHDISRKFMKRTKEIFKSSCKKIDQSNPSRTVRSINKWVAEKTKNKITQLVSDSDITQATSIILVNAIYFAGTWTNPFLRTFTGDFHSPTGVRQIPKMSRQGTYNYYKSDTLNAQVIEIPYKGEHCSMVVILPFSKDGLPVLLRALKIAPEMLNEALDRMRSSDVILTMPKFKIESEFDLLDLYEKVAEKTKNKITQLVSDSDITQATSIILVNAIYFAGTWTNPFLRTFTGDFHSPTGVRQIPKMSRQGTYNYYKSDTLNAQVIEIPYKGEHCSMVVILPFSKDGLPVLLRALKIAPEMLNEALDRMRSSDVILTMPKFKIESEFDLLDLYEKIGLRSMASADTSDLTGIIEDETVFVSKAIHKAVIEVNERGTEAAAATGIQAELLSAMLNVPIFDASHPFIFYISFVQEQLFAGTFSG